MVVAGAAWIVSVTVGRLQYGLRAAILTIPNGRSVAVRSVDCAPTVFTAGRLWDRGKNIVVLDRAAGKLPVPFRAAGTRSGPDGSEVVLRHLEYVGSLDENALADQLATRPIFASAAFYEPFGLAVLEAAAAGCALVLADIATFRENWNGAAIFVRPDDEDGFVAAITSLLSDKSQRLQLGAAAQQRAKQMNPKRMGDATAAVYSDIMQRGSRSGRASAA